MITDDRQGVPASAEFREWFEHTALPRLIKISAKIVAKGEQHIPVLLVFWDNGEINAVNLPLGSRAQKELSFGLHRFLAQKPDVYAAVTVLEAWFVEVDANFKSDDLTKSLADHPDRRDCLQFNAIRGAMQLLATVPIERPGNSSAGNRAVLGAVRMIIDPTDFKSGAEGRAILNRPTRQ